MIVDLVLKIYRFFDKNKWLLYTLLILSTAVFAYFGSKVVYEEDITKLLPSAKSNTAQSYVFEDLRVKDKIFLEFLAKNDTVDRDELVASCDLFMDSLMMADSLSHNIAHGLYRVDDEWITNGMAYLFDNAPLFFDTTAYAALDSLLTQTSIDNQMGKNYELLTSVSSMAYYEMVRRDPLAFRNVLLSGGGGALSAGFGGNYKLLDRHFFTPDSTVLLAFISPNFKSFDSKGSSELVTLLESQIKHFNEIDPNVEVLFHGAPIQSAFNSRQIKTDLFVTLGISVLIVCLVLGLCFRNLSTIPYLMLPVVYGALMALSVVFWMKGSLSIMALGIGAIILGVALSYCIHVVTHFKYLNDPEAVLRDQTKPLLLGCVTTIGVFIGLMFTQSPLLKDFGLFASVAILGTTLFCLIFLPHFFNTKNNRRSERAFSMLDKVNSYPIDQKWGIIVALLLIFGVSLYTKQFVTFDSNLKNIGYNEPNVMRSQKIYNDKVNGGEVSLFYASAARDLDSALTSNRRLFTVLDSLKGQGIIDDYSQTSSLLTTSAEQQQRIDAWKAYWTQERIASVKTKMTKAAAAYSIKPEMFDPFYAMLSADYAPSSLYASGAIPNELMENIVEFTRDSSYMVFTSVRMPQGNQKTVSDAVTAEKNLVVIDPFYYTSDMVELLNSDFDLVVSVSSIFVLLVLLIAYRNLWHAFLAFIPMGLSWFVVLGFMGAFGLQFNLINIVISTFIFGVGVDYSIYVMDGLLGNSKNNYDKLLLYHKTAIIFSAFVLIVTIMSLLFAVHPAIKSIGLITLVGMGSTVLTAYTLQPFLFKMGNRIKWPWKRKNEAK